MSKEKTSPTRPSKRIIAIDLLRGFALLGILIMNIQSFSMPDAAYFNPMAYGDLTGVNRWVWSLSHIFADQKMMSIFSLLFGAGILLFTTRVEERGLSGWKMHYRRNFWLLIFGLVHAYLFWIGDILVAYALCGFIVVWFRKLSPRVLVVLGLIAFSIPSLLGGLMEMSIPYWEPEMLEIMTEEFTPSAATIQHELETYRGSWLTQMEDRIPTAFAMQTISFIFWSGGRAGGLMLVGMALFKWGVLSAQRSRRFYGVLALVGLSVGLAMAAYGVQQNFARGWPFQYSRWGAGFQFNYWGSLLVSMGYIGLIMLWAKWGGLAKLQHALSSVGRMALSNYFLHTLICTTLFYGHGFGLYGSVERTGQVLIMLTIWAFQLIWSPIWLNCFRFGPAEWLWRSLTYWKLQPMKKKKETAVITA